MARARDVRRDSSRPVLIEIATSVPLPFPIDETVTYDELLGLARPHLLALARRAIPTSPSGWAVVAPDLVPNARSRDDALRQLVKRSGGKVLVKSLDSFHGNEQRCGEFLLRRPGSLPLPGSPLRALLWKWKVGNLRGKRALTFWLATDDVYEAAEILAALPGGGDEIRPMLQLVKGPVELVALKTTVRWSPETVREEWWRSLRSVQQELSRPTSGPSWQPAALNHHLTELRRRIVGLIRRRP